MPKICSKYKIETADGSFLLGCQGFTPVNIFAIIIKYAKV